MKSASSVAVSRVKYDSASVPVFSVLLRTTVTPSSVARSTSRMPTTSEGRRPVSWRSLTASRSSASETRARIARYSASEISFGLAAISFGGRRMRKVVPFHARYRFTPTILLLREFALNLDLSQDSYSMTDSSSNVRVPSHPWNRFASRRYSFTVSSDRARQFARMKASNFTPGGLLFGLRILSRIPVVLALVPRVGLYAGQARDLGVHVDQLHAFVPLGRVHGSDWMGQA